MISVVLFREEVYWMLGKSDFLSTWNPSLTCLYLNAELLINLFIFLFIFPLLFFFARDFVFMLECYCLCQGVNVRS